MRQHLETPRPRCGSTASRPAGHGDPLLRRAVIYTSAALASVLGLGLALAPPTFAQQLDENGFDGASSPDAWTVVSPQYSDRIHSSDNATGLTRPSSGSMETYNSATAAYGTAQFRQCLTGVIVGYPYALLVSIKHPAQSASGWAAGTFTYYNNATCNGTNLGVVATPTASSTPADVWATVESPTLKAPPGALSMDVRLFSTKVEPSDTLTVRFDEAYIVHPLFFDGFEGGDTQAWSAVVPP